MSAAIGASFASVAPEVVATSAGGASFVATRDRVYRRAVRAIPQRGSPRAARDGLPRPPRGAAAEGLRLLRTGAERALPRVGRHRRTRARRRLPLRGAHPLLLGRKRRGRNRHRPPRARGSSAARDPAGLGGRRGAAAL